jgi:tetratricopeptide (TPR) repeat protein
MNMDRTGRAAISAAAILALIGAGCTRGARHYLSEGNKLFSQSKYENAAINFRKAIQKEPQFGEAYFQLALTELRQNDGRNAYQHLSRAAELLPDRTDVKVRYADLNLGFYVADNRHAKLYYDKVASISDQLVAKDAKSYDGLRLKAYLAAIDKRLQDAEDFFRRANDVQPMQPELILGWTLTLFQDNQPKEAERLGLQLIEKNKSFGPIYDLLYRNYRLLNRPADAENILKTKVGNNPTNGEYAIQLATFYAAASRPDEMKATVQRMLDNPKTFPEAHLEVGDLYRQMQHWEEAIQQYEEGAKTDPKQKLVYLKRIADVRMNEGKGEQAGAVVNEILKENPGDETAKGVKASLLLASGKPESVQQAASQFKSLVDKNPDNPVWRYNLGRALAAQGDTRGAQTEFQEAIKKRGYSLPPRLALAELCMAKGDYTSARRYAEEILAINRNLPRARFVHAVSLVNTGKIREGRAELDDLDTAFPKSRELSLQLASLDLKQKKYKEAEERFRRLSKENAADAPALAGLVQTFTAEGQGEKAMPVVEDAVKRSPDSEQLRLLLAETAAASGKYDLAIEQYHWLVTKDPKSAQLWMALGKVHRSKLDFPSAIAEFQKAGALEPKDPDAPALLASALELSGRKPEAIVSYRHSLELKPDNVAVMNNLAYLIAESGGNLDEATKLAQEALQKAPEQPNVADTLGWIYLKRNLTASAVQVFRGLTRKYPDNSTFHYHFGLALIQLGDKTKGKAELTTALSKNPSTGLRREIQMALATPASR